MRQMQHGGPLRPDLPENWHTNIGVVTKRLDASGEPLIATADAANSDPLQEMQLFADVLTPAKTLAGARLEVGLDLTNEQRKISGWPWIRVTRPSADLSAGGGGSLQDLSTYSFSSRTVNNTYWLGIDTSRLEPGDYLVWVVYGEGDAIVVPLQILP